MVNGPLGYALEIGSNSFTVHLQDIQRIDDSHALLTQVFALTNLSH